MTKKCKKCGVPYMDAVKHNLIFHDKGDGW